MIFLLQRKEGYGSPVESTVSVVKDCCPEKPIVSPVSDIRLVSKGLRGLLLFFSFPVSICFMQLSEGEKRVLLTVFELLHFGFSMVV